MHIQVNRMRLLRQPIVKIPGNPIHKNRLQYFIRGTKKALQRGGAPGQYYNKTAIYQRVCSIS